MTKYKKSPSTHRLLVSLAQDLHLGHNQIAELRNGTWDNRHLPPSGKRSPMWYEVSRIHLIRKLSAASAAFGITSLHVEDCTIWGNHDPLPRLIATRADGSKVAVCA